MKIEYVVYSEDWEISRKCKTLDEARAHRYQEYGFAGYIIVRNRNGEEIADYS